MARELPMLLCSGESMCAIRFTLLGAVRAWQGDTGDPAAARASFQQALAIFGQLRLPQAEEVRGRLAALTRPGRSLPA